MVMEKEFLYRYFNGDTTPGEDRRVMEWAEASPENYKEYLDERKLWCALVMHATPRPAAKVRRLSWWRVAGAAAVAAVIVGAAGLLYLGPGMFDSRMQTITAPAGQRVVLSLPDGTKVWLNSKSRIEYPVSFGWKSRKINLSGEGYFEVAHNSRRPFIVNAGDYDVRVLGTTFNVYAFDSGKSDFEVSLLEGAVEIAPHDGALRRMVLKPDETAVAARDGSLVRQPLVDKERFLWREGLISLNDVTFGELIERFSYYFDTEIILRNRKLYDVRCTGKFRQSDGIDYSLRVLQNFVKFEYTHDNTKRIVEIR